MSPAGLMALPARGRFIVRGAWVLTVDPEDRTWPRGDILVDDGVIVSIGRDLPIAPGTTVIDARRMIAIPGFVATHEHLHAALFRGIAGEEPDRDAWTVKERLSPHVLPEDTEASVVLACAEALAAGITSTMHWAHNWIDAAEADANLRALVAVGIRARFAPGAPSTKWGLSLAEMDAIMARTGRRVDEVMDVEDLARIARDWFGADRVDGLIRLGVSVRGPARSSERVVREEFEAARRLGIPIYLHCAGTVAEVQRLRQLRMLDAAGLLGPDVGLAHGMQLAPDEIERMGELGVGLAITPVSELRLELGMAPLTELRRAGVVVGLGFDNPAYAATMDMFAAMRVTLGLERTRQGDAGVLAPGDVLRMATIDGARYLGISDVTGSLEPGKRADITLVRRDDLNMAPAGDPLTALVMSAQPTNVDTVIVDGRVLLAGGRHTAIDVPAVIAAASRALRAVCERADAVDLWIPDQTEERT